MALDLEEQEQLAELQSWWKTNGNLVVGVIVVAALAFAGWRYWRVYQAGEAVQAAALYETLGKAAQANDAKAQPQWVIERAAAEDFRDLARLRLAAVLLDEKAHDEALKQLEAAHAAAYDAQYAALKGDILAAKGQPAEARAAYKLALDKALEQDTQFRESVRMRLDALGG